MVSFIVCVSLLGYLFKVAPSLCVHMFYIRCGFSHKYLPEIFRCFLPCSCYAVFALIYFFTLSVFYQSFLQSLALESYLFTIAITKRSALVPDYITITFKVTALWSRYKRISYGAPDIRLPIVNFNAVWRQRDYQFLGILLFDIYIILFSGLLKSIYYLKWKCCLFFPEEVIFYVSCWDGLMFLQLCCVSVL